MCNCLTMECVSCNAPFEIHLGDFDTDPSEIEIQCESCLESTPSKIRLNRYQKEYYIDWTYPSGSVLLPPPGWELKYIRIFYLTKNAWHHRYMNNPNTGYAEPVNEKGADRRYKKKKGG